MTQEKQRMEDRGQVTDEPHFIILSKGLKTCGEYKNEIMTETGKIETESDNQSESRVMHIFRTKSNKQPRKPNHK